MTTSRRAVIDVGTNSVKLLVAEVGDGVVRPVIEDSNQTRLGAGFYETNRLQPQAIADTAQAVATFAAKARELQASSTRVIATSAARDALNPEDLISAVERSSGLKVEIISGDQEAEWAFRGVTTDPELRRQPLLLLDVGGGSTEFILGRNGHQHFCKSFRLGTVRLLEKLPPSDPPTPEQLAGCRQWVQDFLTREVKPELEPAMRREENYQQSFARLEPMNPGMPEIPSPSPPRSGEEGWGEVALRNHGEKSNAPARSIQLIGTGGTSTILARMEAQLDTFNREQIEGMRLSVAQVRARMKNLWSLPLAERRNLIGLPRKRADVILTGVVIYEVVMEAFNFSELGISTRGLRFAAVMDEVSK